jgi:hypothetical protein
MVAAMDSATRAALLAAMTVTPIGGAAVASVAKPGLPLATAETRRNPPFVASVAMLPAKQGNPAEMPPPEIPGWAEPELVTTDQDFSEGAASQDDPVFLATLATWQQSAESCGALLLPSKNPAGNAGNNPQDLAALETLDLIARAELLYGGKIGLNANGPVWRNHTDQPHAEVMAILKERRSDVQAVLLARSHAIKTRTREPDTWTADDWRAFYDERAGIREFDGHLPRQEAERLALADCAGHWLLRNSPAPHSPENGCWQCGRAGTDADGADPLITRNCRGGVFWIHPRCWADYDAAADAAARAAIGTILRGAS